MSMPRTLAVMVVAVLLHCGLGSASAQTFDLTGAWQDDHGAQYTVRQLGGKVYWYMDAGARARNVFAGVIAGDSIAGEWIDLPSGELRNSGQLSLRVESNTRMVKTGESQSYNATVWTRRGAGTVSQGGPVPGGPATYVGCFRDQGDPTGTSGRDLNGAVVNDGRMTTESCVAYCQQRGFGYAGTQYANWCFCGNSYGRSGAAGNCDMKCGGNAAQTCGGTWANSVYQIR